MTGSGRLPASVLAWLAEDHRTESCPADVTYAASVLESLLMQECEDVLHAASQGRWTKANTYSYDAARKSVEALLLAEGWRIRAVAGAHAAAVDLVARWLATAADPGPRIARSFSASRKARHDDEYPSPNAMTRTDRELRALVLDNVRLVNLIREAMDRDPVESVLPTETTLAARREPGGP